jgi:glucosamine--fructose-6-phosphate aminotransferase (isomerizing)
MAPIDLPAPDQTAMFREARESADAVVRQLARNAATVQRIAARLRAAPPAFIATSARGSSDHAATFAKYLFETQLGYATLSASPSVSSVYAAPLRLGNALYLAISQSGRSPDLLRQAQQAREAGAHVIALVNVEDSPLAAVAHDVLPLCAGPEASVAATKSYVCALSALLHLGASWKADAALAAALDALPAALRASWQCDWSALVDGLVDARNLFVVGRGTGLGAAQEAALKLKETCGLHAEAFSAAEVRHGPMAIVGPGFPVLFFTQDDGTAAGIAELAHEFAGRGAPVWVAGSVGAERPLPVAASPHPLCTPLLTITSFYRAANALALQRGRNPDLPPHLRKITETV